MENKMDLFNKSDNSRTIDIQYQNLASVIENTTHRRININGFFLSILTPILGVISVANEAFNVSFGVVSLMALFFYIITLLWQSSIRTYMIHNFTYYNIMTKIEEKMTINYYGFEYSLIKDLNNNISISKREIYLNVLFGLGSFSISIYSFLRLMEFSKCVNIIIIIIACLIFILLYFLLDKNQSKVLDELKMRFEKSK